MVGLIIKGGTFTGAGSKPFLLDPILSSGSLLLTDVKNWESGTPTNDATFANIARDQAANLGLSGDTSAAFKRVGDLVGNSYGLIERSGKGGLHVAVRQSSAIAELHGYNIELPDAVMSYMIANPAHNYYVSQWRKLTRAAASTSPDGAKTFVGIEASGAGGFSRHCHVSGQELPQSSNRIGRNVYGAGLNALGDTAAAISGPYTAGSSPTPSTAQYATGLARSVGQFGSVQRQNNYSVLLAALPSWVFYRAYIEDLTVSGRTHAEVAAIDETLFNESFGSGGRFDGDTYTAPATVD